MVRLLLSRGANINAFDKRDRRAIHWAAYMGKSFRQSSGFIFEDIKGISGTLCSAATEVEAS